MSCCGKGRTEAIGGYAAPPQVQATSNVTVTFEYVGPTSMTVTGPITGAHYRFPSTGTRVRVDMRDRQYLMGVPNLRLIS